MHYVRIYNPETRGLDITVLSLDRFTVQAVFEAMEARGWCFQPGVYVAVKVDGGRDPDSRMIAGQFDGFLTFTVEASERIVRERIAIPA